MTQDVAPVEPIQDATGFGPAMAKLSPQQRAWVVAFLETGPQENATAAARASGYGKASQTEEQRKQACNTAGHRLRHDPRVLEAIKELAKDRFRIVAHRATTKIVELLDNPDPKIAIKAADMIMARSGLGAAQELNVNHRHSIGDMDDKAMIRRIAQLAESQGMDPVKLLGSRGVVIDAEFEVVDTTPEPAMSSEGLEDLL